MPNDWACHGARRLLYRLTEVLGIMNRFAALVGVQALACLLVLSNSSAFAASREAEWKKVDEAIQKGLPKTAIEALEPIIQAALKEKGWDEATRAITRKIVLEGNIQGNKAEEKI